MSEHIPSTVNHEQPDIQATLGKIQQKVQTILEQTANRERALHERSQISIVNAEVEQIKTLVLSAVNEIRELSPDLASSNDFKATVWELLTLPLQYGEGRAAMDYYDCDKALIEVFDAYNAKLEELKLQAFAS